MPGELVSNLAKNFRSEQKLAAILPQSAWMLF